MKTVSQSLSILALLRNGEEKCPKVLDREFTHSTCISEPSWNEKAMYPFPGTAGSWLQQNGQLDWEEEFQEASQQWCHVFCGKACEITTFKFRKTR